MSIFTVLNNLQHLYPNELGATFDCDNPVRNDVILVKNRIDRILIRSNMWNPTEAKILGNEVIDESNPNLRPSDHYGLSVILN